MTPDSEEEAAIRLNEHVIRRLLEGDGSAASAVLRSSLHIPGKLYGLAMSLRRRAYDSGVFRSTHAGVPTISIGNITAGGSGKTPTVALLATRLLTMGHRPAILMRGYTRGPGQTSDEAILYQTLVPDAILAVDPDRRQGAGKAAEMGATVILMDDGFQHRKLRRDLDIVLVDATSPWGGGNTIPGGLLREPKSALRHADVVIVTRSDQVEKSRRDQIVEEASRLAPGAFITTAKHQPNQLYSLKNKVLPLASLNGRDIVVLAGIARPEAFAKTLSQLGAFPVAIFAKSDHHPMNRDFILAAAETAREFDAVVVTTEKDRAKPVFQELLEETADNNNTGVDTDLVESLKRIHVLGVRQKVKDIDGLMERIVRVAPKP